MQKSADELWSELSAYIALHYDLEAIKTIYLSADGGKWIKVGLDYLYGAIFVLDKFHLHKAIKTATEHAQELKKGIYRGIYSLDQEKVLKNLTKAYEQTNEPDRKGSLTLLNILRTTGQVLKRKLSIQK